MVSVDRFASAAIKLTQDYLRPRKTQIVAALDARPHLVGRKIAGVSIVGDPSDIGSIIDEYAVHGVYVDEVWLAEDRTLLAPDLLEEFGAQCAARGVAIVGITEALNFIASPPTSSVAAAVIDAAEKFRGARLLQVEASDRSMRGEPVERRETLPLALCVAYVVFLDVGAPVLFWQQRIGKNGQKFLLYKFRTYRAPFDENGRPAREDQRLSKVGRIIRATRLDELPQLYNVIVGHMSLIGPRPLLPHDQPDDPGPRFSVRPGLTGWAQINGGTVVSPEEKNALDLWLHRHASLRLDLEIVIGTMLVALAGEKLNGHAVDLAIRWYRDEFDAAGREAARGDEAPRDRQRREGAFDQSDRRRKLDAVQIDYPYRAVEPGLVHRPTNFGRTGAAAWHESIV